MVNPIIQALNGGATSGTPTQATPAQSNPMSQIKSMIDIVRGSSNPSYAMQQLAQSDPAIQSTMNYIQQNGGDARSAFYNLAAQKGVDPNQVISFLQNLM